MPALLIAVALSGCPGPFDVEKTTYPCRTPADCARGYQCHPTRYVCVPSRALDGVAGSDGGIRDAGLGRALGALCSAGDTCAEGTCVHGRCCENACIEPCHRCDIDPGRCVLVPDGMDPSNDCAAQSFNCADYTFGIQQTSCYAGQATRVAGGTCNGMGGCRPKTCQMGRPGVELTKCLDPGCLRAGACLPNQPAADFREIEKLCNIGPAFTCDLGAGMVGCCSQRGDCCPAPRCLPTAMVCQ